MVENVVVEGELAAIGMVISIILLSIDRLENEPRNDINALGLDIGPAGLLNLGSGFGELICRDFSSPVGLDSLLDLTVCTLISKSDIKVDICA